MTRSTRSARSSTRACRSASEVGLRARSSRRIVWSGKAAHLGEVARDREHLLAQAVLQRASRAAPGATISSSAVVSGERLDAGAGRARAAPRRRASSAALLAALGKALASCGSMRVAVHGRALTCVTDVGMRTSRARLRAAARADRAASVERRDASRLLVFDRATGAVGTGSSRDLPSELAPGRSRRQRHAGVPARLRLDGRPAGGEVLLLERARRRRVGGAGAADADACEPG